MAALGLAIGGGGAWMLQRGLAAVTFGVSALDAVAWLVMILVVTLTALAASWHPSRQAGRVDPVQLLREE